MPTSASLKIWLFICAAAIAIHLGSPPLFDSDEGRNAEVSREMAATNDYVLPRLNTLPYLDKPIVYFAAAAAVMEVLGPTELAARLPAYLFTLGTAALIFWWTRKRFGGETPWVSAIVFLATPLTIAFARIVIFDSTLTFFIVLAIVAFHEAVETREKRWTVLAWAAIAAGVLTKGPVAIAVPLLIAIPYSIWRRAFGMLWSFLGLAVFAAIVSPWVWAMSQEVPGFLEYVLVTETVARMASDELQRSNPPWFFLPYLIGGALPWSIAAVASWREWKGRDPLVIFVLLWIAVPLIFFSLSRSKQPQYILPLMPAVAILVGSRWRTLRLMPAAIVMAVAGVTLIVAGSLPQLIARVHPVMATEVKSTAIALGVALLVSGIAAAWMRRRELVLVALSLPLIAMPLMINPLMHALGERRSTRSLAAQIAPWMEPDTRLIGVEAFAGSMLFYLRRPALLATKNSSELTSNYLLRQHHEFSGDEGSPVKPMSWLDGELARCCERRVYLTRHKDPENHIFLLQRGARVIARGQHHTAYVHDGRRR